MMLPGVELARRRRVHFHGDAAPPPAGAGDHGHHHYFHAHAHHAAPAPAPAAGPALAARIRLEEKLRGAALPSASTSRWSRLMRQSSRRDDAQAVPEPGGPWRPAAAPPGGGDPAAAMLQAAPPGGGDPAAAMLQAAAVSPTARRELTRTLSKVEVCAVCLEEVRDDERRQQRVARLPCSHKYHSECVLPWLAVHPDCPCCRALVPSLDTLVQA